VGGVNNNKGTVTDQSTSQNYALQFTGSEIVSIPSIVIGNSFAIEFLVRWRVRFNELQLVT
jgi:hypothetical protein